jgi:hypothetical protein
MKMKDIQVGGEYATFTGKRIYGLFTGTRARVLERYVVRRDGYYNNRSGVRVEWLDRYTGKLKLDCEGVALTSVVASREIRETWAGFLEIIRAKAERSEERRVRLNAELQAGDVIRDRIRALLPATDDNPFSPYSIGRHTSSLPIGGKVLAVLLELAESAHALVATSPLGNPLDASRLGDENALLG